VPDREPEERRVSTRMKETVSWHFSLFLQRYGIFGVPESVVDSFNEKFTFLAIF
jgi:hypothetical protein